MTISLDKFETLNQAKQPYALMALCWLEEKDGHNVVDVPVLNLNGFSVMISQACYDLRL